MLNLIISCGDPMERLLYGEPDPWLAQFECRHNHVPDMDGDGRITFVDEIAYEIQQQAQADPEGFLSSSGGGRDEDGFFFTQDDGSRQYVDPDSGAPGTATDNDLDETDDLDRPRTRTERDVDAFLAQPAELAFDGDAEGWGRTSQDAFRADSERETPSRTEEEGDGEHDAVEALIVARGRALGLSEAQIASAIARYRASAVPLRAAAASRGLTNAATDPATALLGAGAHGDNTPSPASANPAERITRAGGSGEVVLGAAEGDRDSRSAGLDGIGETRVVPIINPAYMEWEERNKIPLYLKADGEPLAPNELSVRGWYPAKETYPEFAARHGVDVVLNPNYVEPGERPNQYLDGSAQPVPETWEQAVAAYERDAEPLRRDAGQYETEAATYRTDFDAYEAAVNAWNENPGSAAELKALQDRRERLTTEQARLSASADAINARAQARQADAQNLNDLARLEPSERNRVIRATAGPPELRETRYQEALDAHNDRRRVPRPMSEDANGEYIENYWSKYKAWESANNSAAIELALTAVASGRPVPDRLMVGGTYRTASLSDAATPVEVAQTVREWRADEDWAEKADDDPDGGGGGGSSRDYTVADDGTVSYTQGDHTYTVSDDDLAQDVREAATSGDASGLSSVDQVTVSTGDVGPVAADYNVGEETSGGNYGDLRAAQEAWFREQLANLPDDPAEAAARLAELSARADELNAEWQGRDATFVGPDGQPITGAEYFAQVSASLSVGANENTVIADRNAALPDALAPVTTTFQPNAGLGDRFNADRSAIDARVAAANAIEDPAERAETLAALASDIRDLQEQWTGTDARGWTLGVDHDNDPDTPRVATTATEWWGEYAAGVEASADANRATAEQNTAAAFASDSEALAIAESLGFDVSEITPDQARNLIAGHNEQADRRSTAADAQALTIAERLGFDVSEITPDQARNLIVGHNEQADRRHEAEVYAAAAALGIDTATGDYETGGTKSAEQLAREINAAVARVDARQEAEVHAAAAALGIDTATGDYETGGTKSAEQLAQEISAAVARVDARQEAEVYPPPPRWASTPPPATTRPEEPRAPNSWPGRSTRPSLAWTPARRLRCTPPPRRWASTPPPATTRPEEPRAPSSWPGRSTPPSLAWTPARRLRCTPPPRRWASTPPPATTRPEEPRAPSSWPRRSTRPSLVARRQHAAQTMSSPATCHRRSRLRRRQRLSLRSIKRPGKAGRPLGCLGLTTPVGTAGPRTPGLYLRNRPDTI